MGSTATTLSQQQGYIDNASDDRLALATQNQGLQNLATSGSPLANAQLQQATSQNIQNSAGILASAKGINPAMAARQAGYNQATAGQQAANQSAQTQAQIQLGAQNQLSSNLNNEYNQDMSGLNNQTTLNQQQNQFNANQGLQMFKIASSAVGAGLMGGADGGMVPQKMSGGGMLGGILGGGDTGDVTKDPSADNTLSKDPVFQPASTQIEQPNNPYQQISSFFSGLSQSGNDGPHSDTGKMLTQANSSPGFSWSGPQSSMNPDEAAASISSPPPDNSLQGQFARGGKAKKKVPAMLSPGETYLKPSQAKAVAKGKADPIKIGERIPGKPKVSGNSYANDVVPKKLDAGGVVIPNSIMQSSDPAHNAYKFVQAVMSRSKAKGK